MESVVPICRICLNVSNDYIDFQARFECDGHRLLTEDSAIEINYLQSLRLCTNLPIEENDGGPQCLCAQCAEELDVVYRFLQKAQNSQAILEESWDKKYTVEDTTEIAEISIEKFDVFNIDDGDSEHIHEQNFISSYDELSNDCTEFSIDSTFSNECTDLSNNYNESTKDLYDENNTSNGIPEMEEVVINECETSESLQQIEYIIEEPKAKQQRNTNIFIPKKHKCHICNRFYTTENLLKSHLNYHKRRNVGSKPYSCKICGESFSLQRYLTQHMIEHEDCREMHKCQYCDKEYVTKTALNSHKRIHQGEEALRCDECGKQFFGSYEFSVHQRFHRREKKGFNKCEICLKEFSSPRYLSQHMVSHLEKRESHICNYCNKEYVSKTALMNHNCLYEGMIIKCDVCEKEFTRNCELKMHMRFHKREHTFKCTKCEKEFIIKGHLKTHMWQHEGVKLECGECGKLSQSTKSLSEPSYTHGEMSYPCKLCGKAYPSQEKYKIHIEKMHSSEANEFNLTQIESLTNSKTSKMCQNFIYVQLIKEEQQ